LMTGLRTTIASCVRRRYDRSATSTLPDTNRFASPCWIGRSSALEKTIPTNRNTWSPRLASRTTGPSSSAGALSPTWRDPSLMRVVVVMVIALFLSVLASLALARRMTSPIRALQLGAARIGVGALGERIEVRTGDELEALAESFNEMASQLRDMYNGLEQRV